MISRLFSWIAGAAVALLICWGVSAIFLDSTLPREWDPDIQDWLPLPGTVRKKTSEGWAVSKIGTHGISAIPDVSSLPQKKVAIWGTSFVEGQEVPDPEKMAQVLTSLFQENGRSDVAAIGVGRPFTGVADYYFKIPRYERVAYPVVAHLILFVDFGELIPRTDNFQSKLITQPKFCFVEGARLPEYEPTRRFLHSYRLEFLWQIRNFYETQAGMAGFWPRRSEAPPSTPRDGDFAAADSPSQKLPLEEWRFVLKSLRDVTDLPICFVHASRTPRIIKVRICLSGNNHLLYSSCP